MAYKTYRVSFKIGAPVRFRADLNRSCAPIYYKTGAHSWAPTPFTTRDGAADIQNIASLLVEPSRWSGVVSIKRETETREKA